MWLNRQFYVQYYIQIYWLKTWKHLDLCINNVLLKQLNAVNHMANKLLCRTLSPFGYIGKICDDVSALPATNLTARHCIVSNCGRKLKNVEKTRAQEEHKLWTKGDCFYLLEGNQIGFFFKWKIWDTNTNLFLKWLVLLIFNITKTF